MRAFGKNVTGSCSRFHLMGEDTIVLLATLQSEAPQKGGEGFGFVEEEGGELEGAQGQSSVRFPLCVEASAKSRQIVK